MRDVSNRLDEVQDVCDGRERTVQEPCACGRVSTNLKYGIKVMKTSGRDR